MEQDVEESGEQQDVTEHVLEFLYELLEDPHLSDVEACRRTIGYCRAHNLLEAIADTITFIGFMDKTARYRQLANRRAARAALEAVQAQSEDEEEDVGVVVALPEPGSAAEVVLGVPPATATETTVTLPPLPEDFTRITFALHGWSRALGSLTYEEIQEVASNYRGNLIGNARKYSLLMAVGEKVKGQPTRRAVDVLGAEAINDLGRAIWTTASFAQSLRLVERMDRHYEPTATVST